MATLPNEVETKSSPVVVVRLEGDKVHKSNNVKLNYLNLPTTIGNSVSAIEQRRFSTARIPHVTLTAIFIGLGFLIILIRNTTQHHSYVLMYMTWSSM